MIKERPIIFNAEIVNAILDGHKTQHRQVMKVQPLVDGCQLAWDVHSRKAHWVKVNNRMALLHNDKRYFLCPFGKVGDRLWVRETWQTHCDNDHLKATELQQDCAIQYPASYDGWVSKKRTSTQMPRWASRITLEITKVRFERLNDISDADALAEGVDRTNTSISGYAKERFKRRWEKIYGDGSWMKNPFVWVIDFKIFEVKK